MIIVIDGPAGAGKSSAAKALARRLGFRFLDTGAMYRAVTLAALRRGVAWDDPAALAAVANEVSIELGDQTVKLDGEDVTRAIRSVEITSLVHYVADNPAIRARLVELQRQAAAGIDVVTEGRDQGTVVFPAAECKIFLTASPEERARRRIGDLEARGEHLPFDEVLRQQNLRDERDSSRQVGPLVRAADAVELNTDGLTSDEVVDRLQRVVQSCMPRT
ncbi:MAG TPA: (d)CMP kinase [Pirellulales bacterium]|nr:(d)CMP kinase [Pirellulales bacterium]